jgi:UDP-hydrolysing UDP-N-acetyl-D-glucosamine 2-epimerase
MSHLHFVALEKYKKRLIQMGEERWRVKNIGIHELNNLKTMNYLSREKLQKIFNFDFIPSYCLLTFHPVTLELKSLKTQIENLIKAIKKTKINAVITYPNADPLHQKVIKIIKSHFIDKKKYLIIKNCGEKKYASLLKHSEFVIGNSSSGIVEATTLKKASINIGTRQNGKLKPGNVLDADYSINSIIKSIKKAMSPHFKKKTRSVKNPYESKININKIVDLIVKLKINDKLLRKKFINIK